MTYNDQDVLLSKNKTRIQVSVFVLFFSLVAWILFYKNKDTIGISNYVWYVLLCVVIVFISFCFLFIYLLNIYLITTSRKPILIN